MAEHHKWSRASNDKLSTCQPELIGLCNAALKLFPHDLTIIEGHRSNERQDELFRQGKSKVRAGQSKHNHFPSKAVDIAPVTSNGIEWSNRELWIGFMGFMRGLAAAKGIKIRVGVDWDGDYNSQEHSFFDGPHIELLE